MSDRMTGELNRNARFFSEFSDELALQLGQHGRRLVLEKGALLHRKGDIADGLYSVISGRIRISTLSADGRELVLTDLMPGSVFGEISLFDDRPRTHDALALVRSELVIVPKREFHALLDAQPKLARHFLRVLATRLRLSFAVLDALALQDVTQRLAQRLVWLLDNAANDDGALEVSQTDLALMVGATRQSVNKQLKLWERDGVLARRGRRLLVLDRAALTRVSTPA